MRRSRRSLLLLVGLLCPLLIAALVAGLQVASAFPASGRAPAIVPGVHGVSAGGACVWIITGEGGVLLIDAGGDPEAKELVEALRGLGLEPDSVQGILLTSGYPRHVAGVARFPAATIYSGPGEAALIRQERTFRAGLGALNDALSKTPPSAQVGELEEGAVLTRAGRSLKVVSLPGHTLGSSAYLLDDSVLFTGDAVLVDGASLRVPPGWMNEDPARAATALERLARLPHARVADGHCRTRP